MRPAWLVRPEGSVPYDAANAWMHDLGARRLADEVPEVLTLLEHPPVFTAGRRARPEELLWDETEVEARGGIVRRIDRGGAFTFHGPGQLVAYPVVDLGAKPDAARYLRALEGAVIGVCGELGVEVSARPEVQTGVWRGDAKICAIGVRLLRARVTLHGLALNCDPDLTWFDGIVACGLPEHGVTSLSRILGRPVGVDEVRPLLERALADALELDLRPAPAEAVAPLLAAAGV
jgi:lipoyl(octanoyl) transferase